MASYRPSSHLNKIRGSVSRIVHSRNKSGEIMYLKPIYKYHPTPWQHKSTDHTKKIALKWSNDLTDIQYEAWNSFASKLTWYNHFGLKYTPDAYLTFSTCNRNRKEIGMDFILDAPKKISVQSFSDFSLEIPSDNAFDDILLYFKPGIKEDTLIKIYATGFLRRSALKVKPSAYTKIGYIDYSFFSGHSIFHLYKSIIKEEIPQAFKIAFKFIPVTASTGLTAESSEIFVSFRQI